MAKYNKIKIAASNGLSIRNGPNIISDIVGKVPNEGSYTVADVVEERHYLWGYVPEVSGWILLENLKTQHSNVVHEKSKPKKLKQRAVKKQDLAEPAPEEPSLQVEPLTTETDSE